jgi:phosphoribosylglycinamide formyltransferase-1
VEKKKISLAVLISGGGSNLQAIIDAIKNNKLDAQIKAVISNNVSASGLDRAARENITTHVIEHKSYPSREAFDQAMSQVIDAAKVDLVVLAGFMRILSKPFIEHYQHRLINIHPSLLPKYKGLNTHQQVIDNNDKFHGASVHFVNQELDSGPTVIQAEMPVLATDNAETLATRILIEEHQIYPMVIQMIAEGRLSFDKNQLNLDNEPLTRPLCWKDNQLT